MNCFAHALPHLDDPYFAVGCCIPDWLSALDRKVRAREKLAIDFVDHDDEIVSALARGVVQQHRDDDWFHRTPIFNELSLQFAVELRELYGNERSMRPGLVGHILVELFLDAYLHERSPGKMDFFYEQVARVKKQKVQDSVNLFTTRPTEKLVWMIERFCSEKFLYDYSTDGGTIYRLNRVLERIGLKKLDSAIDKWMPGARQVVYENAVNLLRPHPTGGTD